MVTIVSMARSQALTSPLNCSFCEGSNLVSPEIISTNSANLPDVIILSPLDFFFSICTVSMRIITYNDNTVECTNKKGRLDKFSIKSPKLINNALLNLLQSESEKVPAEEEYSSQELQPAHHRY